MSVAVTGRRVLMVALCLAVQLSAGASTALSFTTGSLKGRWTVHFEPATSFGGSALGNPAGVTGAARQHVMRVGYIDWNGLGTASGRFIALTDTNSGQTMVIDYQWSGTYAVNVDGTGTLSVTTIELAMPAPVCTPDPPPEGGVCSDYVGPDTFAFTIGKRSGTVDLVQQNNAGGAKIFLQGQAVRQFRITTPYFFTAGALRRTWAVRLKPATSFAAIAPGDPGGVASAPRQDVMRVGLITFDGFGTAYGRMIATTDDNSGQTVVVDYQWFGAYTMNSDGTGTVSVTPLPLTDANCTPAQTPGVCATFEGPESYAFSLSKSRQQLNLIQTDNSGGGAKIFLFGTAAAQ
jgi:hypothetical protein